VVSTLKLTKIQIPNSDSDVLSFNSSTGIMTFHKDIKGEGTATTNLQQGLIKVWARMDCNTSSAVTLNDSFNVSSVSDTAVGRSIINFSNNMSNTTYALLGAGDATIGVEYNYVCCESSSTDHVDVAHMYGHSSLIDTKDNGHGLVGDLA
jgi:hypothetical protein